MKLEDFFQEKLPQRQEETVVLSDRLKDHAFVIAPVNEEEDEEIRRRCRRSDKGGATILNREKYLLGLVCRCVRFPDLKDAALQRSWGVLGEENLLKKMLLPGEYDMLARRVEEICGFSETERLVSDLKKA